MSCLSFLSKSRSLRTSAATLILPVCLTSSRPEGILIPISYIKTVVDFCNLFNPSEFQLYIHTCSPPIPIYTRSLLSPHALGSSVPIGLFWGTSYLVAFIPSFLGKSAFNHPPRLLVLQCLAFQLLFLSCSASCLLPSTTALFSCFSDCTCWVSCTVLSVLAFEIVLFPRVHTFVIW